VQGVRGNIGWNSTKIRELKEGYKEVQGLLDELNKSQSNSTVDKKKTGDDIGKKGK